jgi:hypothetical protein
VETSVSHTGGQATAGTDDRRAEKPAEDGAATLACCSACGGAIAEILLSLGSTCCHDCRGGQQAA